MKIWAKTKEFKEGKFLVVRRDGTMPAWPHFVLGARDEAAEAALLAYASKAEELGWDAEYIESIQELANDFSDYRKKHGQGDAPSGPHRKDDPDVIEAMRGNPSMIQVIPSNPAKPGGKEEPQGCGTPEEAEEAKPKKAKAATNKAKLQKKIEAKPKAKAAKRKGMRR